MHGPGALQAIDFQCSISSFLLFYGVLSMTPQAVLAQPFTLPNGTVIKNRLFKSAMSEALGNRDKAPTPELVRLYQAWADGGVGLCVTGNVMIDRRALGEPGNVVIEDDRDLAELKAWAQAGTRNGTQCWVQLNHPGKQSPKGLNKETVSPSAVPPHSSVRRLWCGDKNWLTR
jgi:2,4-dienoyl-CoA reductase-like NADH-dependent reductase (Old Yellow Enzyme family)